MLIIWFNEGHNLIFVNNLSNQKVKMHFRRPKCVQYTILLVFLSLLAVIQGFIVEDSCKANGKICTEDTECCSNWCVYGGPYWPNKCEATLTCNGNCPVGNCKGCQCPPIKNMTNVDTYCASDSGWKASCCKCIVNRISGGNSNFQRLNIQSQIGVIPIDYQTFVSICKISYLKMCDWEGNKQCAQFIYKWTDSWVYWESDAKACGCSN